MEKSELSKTFDIKVEEVDDNIDWKSTTNKPTIYSSGIPNERTLRWLEIMAQFSFSIGHHVGLHGNTRLFVKTI